MYKQEKKYKKDLSLLVISKLGAIIFSLNTVS